MGFVVAGLLNKHIAAELGTSDITVKIHRHQIMHKMQGESLAKLVRMASSSSTTMVRELSDRLASYGL